MKEKFRNKQKTLSTSEMKTEIEKNGRVQKHNR